MSGARATAEVQIGSRGFVGLEAVAPEVSIDGPLFAVNLLDLRLSAAYTLYGLLVISRVLRAGGRVLFKGSRSRVLAAGSTGVRETLLVVRYPGTDAFLGLVRQPFFMAASLLRRIAIRNFRFGFAERFSPGSGGPGPEPFAKPRRYRGDRSYLFLGFEGGREAARESIEAVAAALGSEVEVYFAGLTSAHMTVRGLDSDRSRPSDLAPPLALGGVLILTAAAEQPLEALLTDTKAGLQTGGSFQAALFERTV